MTFKLYTPETLTNEQYHSDPAISGSGLNTIYQKSLAHFKYGEVDPEKKPLKFGTYSHSMILENDRFNAEYAREPIASDWPEDVEVLTSDAAIKAKLKELGDKGYTSKSGSTLWQFAAVRHPDLFCGKSAKFVILKMEQSITSGLAEVDHKELICGDWYDELTRMRSVIMADEDFSAAIEGSAVENSIIGWVKINESESGIEPASEGEPGAIKVKIRPDMITKSAMLVNYKTTTDCSMPHFGNHSIKLGYVMRCAFEYDVFTCAYGHPPSGYCLLAQEKEAPYICEDWYLSDEWLSAGREQYLIALKMYEEALRLDKWSKRFREDKFMSCDFWAAKELGMVE